MKFCHYRGISLVTVLVTWQCSHCRCFWSFGALYKKLVTWLEVQILPWKWPVRNPHFQPSKRYGPFKQLVSQLSMYAGNISYIWHKVLFQGCFFEAIQLQFVYFWPKSIKKIALSWKIDILYYPTNSSPQIFIPSAVTVSDG